MPDRIDPGLGWRLLRPKEIVKDRDEFLLGGAWRVSRNVGTIQCWDYRYRRRISKPYTTKAIATQATVICATPDGVRDERTISRKSGLTECDCERIGIAWKNAQASPAKYIMLEIQREGEP